MKPFSPLRALVAALGGGVLATSAQPLAEESFDAPAAATLTGQAGGPGWAGPWTQDGLSALVRSDGLGYTDTAGNALITAGRSISTANTATTRNFRTLAGGPYKNVWIAFLYRLPAGNQKFEGVTFYRGAQALFSVSNPSTDATASIVLGNSLAGTSVPTGKGAFGATHLIVLQVEAGAGAGGADRVRIFVDPLLSQTPAQPQATTNGSDFGFDTVRLAGQDGSALELDELRIGPAFADVTPHAPAPADADGDGLTDAQESELGLDPTVSDAALIAGIQAHPDWFGLYDTAGILALDGDGPVLQRPASGPLRLIFEAQHSPDLASWSPLATYQRWIELPAGKNFLRLSAERP